MKSLSILLFVCSFSIAFAGGKNRTNGQIQASCQQVHELWLREAFDLTKNCVGFSVPVSARAYAYLSIAAYESTVEVFPNQQSLSTQLNGYVRSVYSKKKQRKTLDWQLVANAADHHMVTYLYRGMPPSNKTRVQFLYDSIIKTRGLGVSEDILASSLDYGVKLAEEIIQWSRSDGGDEGYLHNFPVNYDGKPESHQWRPTTPGYLPPLLPTWGTNRTFFSFSHELMSGCRPPDVKIDSSGWIYKDALEIKDLDYSNNPEFEVIAEYWNDAPGYSGTPPGHFFSLAMDLVKQLELDPGNAMQLYVKLGVALNEAVITCWKLKYDHQLIRPVSFIQRYIYSHYNTLIDSPPFPEFPSGHSFQSGAGTEVLKSFFGNNITFTDSTLLYRKDIVNTPRTFHSIDELAEEISISRLYGGIHYRTTLNLSLHYGKMLGQRVAQEIKCTK